MSLRAIVTALGGDLYQNGCRASVPAPGHGAGDRSVSLVMSEGRVVVHSFGGADWREVLNDLRTKGLIDRAARPTGGGRTTAPSRPDSRLRLETARTLWACGVDNGAEGLVARHLRRRGVIWNPEVLNLREHPAAPLSIYGGGSRRRRAMMARVSDPEGATTAVELTYLNPGRGPGAQRSSACGRPDLDRGAALGTVGRLERGPECARPGKEEERGRQRAGGAVMGPAAGGKLTLVSIHRHRPRRSRDPFQGHGRQSPFARRLPRSGHRTGKLPIRRAAARRSGPRCGRHGHSHSERGKTGTWGRRLQA